MKIGIGSDHGGFDQKAGIVEFMQALGHEVIDYGPGTSDSVDYPDYAVPVAKAVASGELDRGVLICGTGIGMSLSANKIKGIRAVPVQTEEFARLCRAHNNCNVLCLSGRFVDEETNKKLVEIFLTEPWEGDSEGGERHACRVAKIMAEEE